MPITIPVPDYIGFLVNRRFPKLSPPPPKMERILNSNGIVYDLDEDEWIPPSRAIMEKAQKYREKLEKLPKQKIKDLYKEEKDKKNLEDDKIRFFNTPDAEADFDYWSKMAEWSLDEAIALSFGKNPKVVNWKSLQKILSYTSPFVRKYSELQELTKRAKSWKHLYDPIIPILYVNWAMKNDVPFPHELAQKVSSRNSNLIDWKKMYDNLKENYDKLQDGHDGYSDRVSSLIQKKDEYEKQLMDKIERLEKELQNIKNSQIKNTLKPMHTKEKETLLKLVIGMAVEQYAYDPNSKRNEATANIVSDLETCGVSLDADTVRDKLKQASELLPQDNQKSKIKPNTVLS